MTLKLLLKIPLLKLLKTQKFYFGGKKMAFNLEKTYEIVVLTELVKIVVKPLLRG